MFTPTQYAVREHLRFVGLVDPAIIVLDYLERRPKIQPPVCGLYRTFVNMKLDLTYVIPMNSIVIYVAAECRMRDGELQNPHVIHRTNRRRHEICGDCLLELQKHTERAECVVCFCKNHADKKWMNGPRELFYY